MRLLPELSRKLEQFSQIGVKSEKIQACQKNWWIAIERYPNNPQVEKNYLSVLYGPTERY